MDNFVPDMYQKSIFTIDYEKLKKSGIKCILFDLDNTIAPITSSSVDLKTKNLFEELKEMGFKIIIISNSGKQRVEPFKEGLNVDAAHSAKKPFKAKYLKILKLYDFLDNEVAAVGDQLLTDIYGANKMGFTSILVNPISKTDLIWTKFNRKLEARLMKKMAKKGVLEKEVYHD